MIFLSGLKRICDISFYMTFASMIGPWFAADSMIASLPIFVFVAFLSAFLAPRGHIRYISIMPLFFVFLIIPLTLVNVIILAPAVVYMIITLPKTDESTNQFDYNSVFYWFLLIFGFIALLVTAMSSVEGTGGLTNETWLFAASFLFNSIMFMRMARHDTSVLKQTRFKMMNATTLIGTFGIIGGAVVLGTDALFAFVWRVFTLLWIYLIAPVINAVMWVFLTTVLFIFNIFGLDLDNIEIPEIELELEMYTDVTEELEPGNVLSILAGILFAITLLLVIASAIFLLIKLFKLLTSKFDSFVRDDDVEEEIFLLDEHEKRERRFGRRNENQVREVYRKFLIYVKKKGINIPLHLTSSDVEGLVTTQFESEKTSELRDEYIRVRYGEFEYTGEDVKRIKGLYKNFKNEIE